MLKWGKLRPVVRDHSKLRVFTFWTNRLEKKIRSGNRFRVWLALIVIEVPIANPPTVS